MHASYMQNVLETPAASIAETHCMCMGKHSTSSCPWAMKYNKLVAYAVRAGAREGRTILPLLPTTTIPVPPRPSVGPSMDHSGVVPVPARVYEP